VRQLVDQDQLGPAGQRGVDVELLQPRAVIADPAAGQKLQAAKERLGLGAAVRLDIACQHVGASSTLLVGGRAPGDLRRPARGRAAGQDRGGCHSLKSRIEKQLYDEGL